MSCICEDVWFYVKNWISLHHVKASEFHYCSISDFNEFQLPYLYYNKSQRVVLFLKFVSVKNSTCFGQICHPSSGVSTLCTQQQVFDKYLLLCIQCWDFWWWTVDLSETCRVLYQTKFENLCILLAFIIRIYHDAWSSESQIIFVFFFSNSCSGSISVKIRCNCCNSTWWSHWVSGRSFSSLQWAVHVSPLLTVFYRSVRGWLRFFGYSHKTCKCIYVVLS